MTLCSSIGNSKLPPVPLTSQVKITVSPTSDEDRRRELRVGWSSDRRTAECATPPRRLQ